MSQKLLWLILAGGKGERVRQFLTEDEPVKPMIKIGQKILIEYALEEAERVGHETAVLAYPSALYGSLDRLVESGGVKIMKQKARHRKLPHLLELAYIIWKQYNSSDREYLASFESILTFASDIVYRGVDFKAMIDFHNQNLSSSNERQITMLSKRGTTGRAYNFKVENGRLASVQWFSNKPAEGYSPYVSPGVYIFSRAVLIKPFTFLLGLDYNKVLIYETQGTWRDYGDPEVLRLMK